MTTAREVLDRALVDLANAGKRPRCGDPELHHLWTSDKPDERARAAELCLGCLVLQPCAESAEELEERFHVWAGTDRTRTAKKETHR